jgi:bleomycin hydrolase
MKTNHADEGGLTYEQIAGFRTAFSADPRNRVALNAVTKHSIHSIAQNRDAVTRISHTFSHTVKAGKSTFQKSSGRCWMFAGLNLFRMSIAEKLNSEDFELSQNYLMFWDKLEKSNYFLESILGTRDEATDSRLISHLLSQPIQDGGQWDMFVNLIKKYGVVPKEAMPETESSSNSRLMNAHITATLREFACRLRQMHRRGAGEATLRGEKAGMLEGIYRMLAIHLGEPPREFLWQWRDKDKEFHREGLLTPQQFRDKYIQQNLDELVCLIHCPQESKQYNTLYTVAYLGNVMEGHPVRYINVEIETLKAATVAQIHDEKPVWFGCDVGKHFDRDLGVMDMELYDYASIYGGGFTLNKAERLDYGQSQMTHAMVLTGVDLDENERPRKWRVENSWGDQGGDKGFMLMTDAWFDEYLYEVVVERQYVPAELLSLLDTQPTVLDPWDPMGALAR